jgi:hypothetical protein
MPKIKKLPVHTIARRVRRVPGLENGWIGQLLPTEIEYVCRRSAERNKRLDRKREEAAYYRERGLAVKLSIVFTANHTFNEELLKCQHA